MSIEMIFRNYREIRPQSNLLLILNEPLLCDTWDFFSENAPISCINFFRHGSTRKMRHFQFQVTPPWAFGCRRKWFFFEQYPNSPVDVTYYFVVLLACTKYSFLEPKES